MNRISFKLFHDFDKRAEYKELFKNVDYPLSYLKSIGVDALEVPFNFCMSIEEVYTELCEFINEGFKVSIHPYTCRTIWDYGEEACNPYFDRLFDKLCKLNQAHIICNVHGAMPSDNTKYSRGDYLGRTVCFLDRYLCRLRGTNIEIVLELQQRSATEIRIADTWKELSELSHAVDMRMCLDIGHMYLNNLAGADSTPLPTGGIDRIAHAHVHGIHDVRDHCTLDESSLPWEMYINELLINKYEGSFILEIMADNMLKEGKNISNLKTSICLLKEQIQKSLNNAGVI